MSMVCPDCRESYDQALLCPKCGVRLHYQASGRGAPFGDEEGQSSWQHTPWGRVLVGVLVAQGLVHGLQMLCNAGLLATSDEPARSVWQTVFGLVLLQVLHGVALLIGGALTAAGQRRGGLLGALVGLASGSVFLIVQRANGEPLTEVTAYGQPVLAVILGAVGGLLGSFIWKPLPALSVPGLVTPSKGKAHLARSRRPGILSGPVAWVRVLLGTGIVTVGVLWPQTLLDLVLDASRGQVRLESQLQAKLLTWEIAGILMLLGGAVAGATTRNGFKHGLFVGVGAGVLLLGHALGSGAGSLEQTTLLAGSVLVLGTVGGWFGGQLFPPILVQRRDRVGSLMY